MWFDVEPGLSIHLVVMVSLYDRQQELFFGQMDGQKEFLSAPENSWVK